MATTTTTPQTEALEQWLRNHGGFLHRDVRIARDDEGNSGHHWRATATLAPGATVAIVPHSLALSWLNAFVDDVYPVFRHLRQQKAFPVEAIGFFYLMTQWVQREMSFWKPYFDCLPPPDAKFSQPLWFEDASDVVWLDGTDVWHTICARKAIYENYYASGVSALKDAGVDVEPYTWSLFKWAVTMFSSRSFSSRALRPQDGKYWTAYKSDTDGRRQTVSLDMSNTPAEDTDFPVLFPAIDSGNHSPHAKADWVFDSDRFSVTINDTAAAGDEVYNNYGPKGNDELLLGYGFCIPDNPHDRVMLTLKAPPKDLQDNLRAVHPGYFTSGEWSSEKTTFGLRHSTSDPVHPSHIFHQLPEPLLELLVYILRDERGLNFKVLENPLEQLTAMTQSGGLKVRRYLPHMARMLVQSLVPKMSKLQVADLPNGGEPQTLKQLQSSIYRQGQQDILSSLIAALRLYTRSLLWVPRETSLPERPALVILESLISILRVTDQASADDFIAGIETNAGSSDLEQLRFAGWEEDIFVLLICWLILYARQARVQQPQASNVGWICDMLSEYADSTVDHTSFPRRGVSRDELGSQVVSPEEIQQARSLMEVVHAAAAVAPLSLWSSDYWREEFIAGFGGQIFKHESFQVMVTHEDAEGAKGMEARLCFYVYRSI